MQYLQMYLWYSSLCLLGGGFGCILFQSLKPILFSFLFMFPIAIAIPKIQDLVVNTIENS